MRSFAAIAGYTGGRPAGDQPATPSRNAPVAQLDRASDYESEGRTFESFRARHFGTKLGNPKPAAFALEAATSSIIAVLAVREKVRQRSNQVSLSPKPGLAKDRLHLFAHRFVRHVQPRRRRLQIIPGL